MRKTLSPEHKQRISIAMIGKKNSLGHKVSDEHKQKISSIWKGKKLSDEHINKLSISHIGQVQTPESRLKNSNSNKGSKGSNWRGGINDINDTIRKSLEYRQWRTSVFIRDDYTCVLCGKKGGDLEADHIKQFAYFPELRFEVSNGRTLCNCCHKSTDTYGKSI